MVRRKKVSPEMTDILIGNGNEWHFAFKKYSRFKENVDDRWRHCKYSGSIKYGKPCYVGLS